MKVGFIVQSKKIKAVDNYINNSQTWHKEFLLLRDIIISTGLQEEIKWRNPCYTFEDKNIVLIQGFKDYCALLFINGVLLQDEKKILVQQTKNTLTARQLRFQSETDIVAIEDDIKQYIFEAIELSVAGIKVEAQSEIEIVEELQEKFNQDPKFEKAFNRLTPGRKRAYSLYFSAAKQSKTRISRIEKHYQAILAGLGLND